MSVRALVFGVALSCAGLGAAHAGAEAGSGAPTGPRPGPLPAVVGVTISVSGARSDAVTGDETVEDCAAFRPREAQVASYFQKARRVSYRAYTHELDASRCYAAGGLLFADRGRGTWRIDREGRGSVVRPGAATLYFLCTGCIDSGQR